MSTQWSWLIPLLPFLASVVGFLGGRRLPGGPAPTAVAGTLAALGVSLAVLPTALGDPGRARVSATAWFPTGSTPVEVGTRIDGLAAVMAVMVCIVALLVQVYSPAYMEGDRRYWAYAAEVSLFTAAMLLVVVASNLFELYVGWEVMGICSYLLIGHYWWTPKARDAAVKAFVTTRVGDVCFLAGIFVLGLGVGSFGIGEVVTRVGDMSGSLALAGALLILGGVVGKSAQFPLHVWLPDAMAGPTPISALIHAATMVAAGIYVVARLYPVYVAAPVALDVLGVIAAITMLLGALAALAQDDLKRVLAWSTVSQLAYMAGGLATGGWTAGVYHLLTHAAFKALLFLAAGSVLRSVGTNLMSEMGGLRRTMPLTFVTMLAGALALAGIVPFAGAFSKDAVLGAAHAAATGDASAGTAQWVGWLVYVVGLATVVVTAAYVTRMVGRTFFGSYRGSASVHESPPLITVPLVILSVFTLVLGIPALPDRFGVQSWLGAPAGASAFDISAAGVGLTTALALLGAGLMLLAFRAAEGEDPVRVLGRARPVLEGAFLLDTAYDRLLVRPVRRLAVLTVDTDRRAVDGAVVGSGRAATGAGGGLRRLQNGNVQAYATGVLGAVVLIVVSVAVSR